jgi:hypothetical protein
MARAQQFYKTVFGWEFSSTNATMVPAGCYAMFSKPGTQLHGGMPLVKAENLLQPKVDAAGTWQATNRVVVMVEEVGEALKAIKAAGGETVREKAEIGPDMGFSAQFRDTEGNVNGVWSQK